MSATPVEACGLCGGRGLAPILDLGSSPPTCHMQPVNGSRPIETHYPLELLRCDICTLVQLSVMVDPTEVFPPDYPYSSGNSKALHENFEDLARSVEYGPEDLVVDIGANDGTLLSKFDTTTKVGVEPTSQGASIDGHWWHDFFSAELAQEIRAQYGPAKVVTACNVLAHVEDMHDVMAGIRVLLADDGVLVAENHELASVVNGQWDTVYHEHLRFFDSYSFSALLRGYGFRVTRYNQIPTHGGSFRMFARHGGPDTRPYPPTHDFGRLTEETSRARAAIRLAAVVVPRMWGIGATARATTIINYCGLDVEDLECVVEVSGSDKIGRYIPGTRIPVIDEQRLLDEQPPWAMLLSWHLADKIVPRLREQGYTGRIAIPLPTLRYA